MGKLTSIQGEYRLLFNTPNIYKGFNNQFVNVISPYKMDRILSNNVRVSNDKINNFVKYIRKANVNKEDNPILLFYKLK